MRFLGLIICLFISIKGFGSHVIGGDLTYRNLGGDTFEITLSVLTDCGFITQDSPTQQIEIYSSCTTINLILTADSITNQGNAGNTYIEHACNSGLANWQSSCIGGPVPATRKAIYKSIVVLPSNCGTYTLNHQYTCCPPLLQNIGAQAQSVNVSSQFTQYAYSGNSSPFSHTTLDAPMFYVGQNASYDFKFFDLDGDSLFYEFYQPFSTINQPSNYLPNFNINNQINGILIDSITGLIRFTTVVSGNFRVTVKVNEYDKITNAYKGFVVKDVIFVIHNGNSQTNEFWNLQSNKIFRNIYPASDKKNITICLGDTLKLKIRAKELNGDHLAFYNNIQNELPSAIINQSVPFTSDSARIELFWVPTQITPYRKFLRFGLIDDSCPIKGYSDEVYTLEVISNGLLTKSTKKSICPFDTVNLNGTGNHGHNWLFGLNTLHGCDTCLNSWAIVDTQKTLVYEGILPSGCLISDSILIDYKSWQKPQLLLPDTFCNNVNLHWPNYAKPKNGIWLDLLTIPNNTGYLADTSGGIRTFKYAIVDSVCGIKDTAIKTVYLRSAPIVVWNDSFEICYNSPPMSVATAMPQGGGYSGYGIDSVIGIFNPKHGILNMKSSVMYWYRDPKTLCRTMAVSNVFVLPLPAVSISPIPPICESEDTIVITQMLPKTGGIFILNGNKGDTIHPNLLGFGNYTGYYAMEDSNGCRDTASRNFTIDSVPNTPQIILLGNDTISSTVIGGFYNWYWNGSLLSNQSELLVNPNIGTYQVEVINGTCTSEISERFTYNPLGIDNHTQKEIQVYPNPNKGEFFIEFSKKSFGKTASIYNSLGQKIDEFVPNQQYEKITISKVGIYFIKIDELLVKQKIIVQ